jgi:hypothetical protein
MSVDLVGGPVGTYSLFPVSSVWRLATAGQTEPQGGRHELETSGKKGDDTPLGYSGRTALRREQCDGFAQALACLAQQGVTSMQYLAWSNAIRWVLIARCRVMKTYYVAQQYVRYRKRCFPVGQLGGLGVYIRRLFNAALVRKSLVKRVAECQCWNRS